MSFRLFLEIHHFSIILREVAVCLYHVGMTVLLFNVSKANLNMCSVF